ncbi:MAG: hypothetical protein KBA11_09820 [Sedimentibacter sp.]|jgi:5-hydroxyisourate hydrolase-like protein (transthyretin family)|nr:hypothetical protein [Sedimentibacter sp.]
MKYYSSSNKYRNSDINKFNMNNNFNNEGTGFLEITVSDAQTGMPVAQVDIEVYKMTIMGEYAERAVSELVVRYSTSDDGTIPLIELPVIEWPLNRYFARLDTFGYYDVSIVNIPIYEGVKTIYEVKLNRITSPTRIREYIRTPTRTEYYTPPVWFY